MKTSTGYSKRKIAMHTYFSFLIVLDILSVIHFVTELDFTSDQVKMNASRQRISLDSKMNAIFTNSSDNFQMSLSAISELLGRIVLLFCNILGIFGIQHHNPYQLVPWLVVYIIGIISSYIGSFLLLSTVRAFSSWMVSFLLSGGSS